ncbi:MAG TPA: hypothetical protein VH743_04580 [Beijerinckiaceae bacterium]|jgi:hypothetical protein
MTTRHAAFGSRAALSGNRVILNEAADNSSIALRCDPRFLPAAVPSCRHRKGRTAQPGLRAYPSAIGTAMYLVIRKFSRMRTVREAARRAESGIAQLMKQSPGFRGYYIFDAGDGVAGSVTFFDDQQSAAAANVKALAWIQASLSDLIHGQPEVISGEVLIAVTPDMATGLPEQTTTG